MSIEEPSFWKYLVVNDEGIVEGISPDAPEKEIKAYEEFKEQERKLVEEGIKL